MAEIIRMPRMSDTMEEGNIVGWLKKVGDSVEPGDVLAEVETDKATMELESYQEGYLLHIGVEEGPVLVNGVLAIIGEKGEDISSLLKEIAKGGSAVQAQVEAKAPAETSAETAHSKEESLNSNTHADALEGATREDRVKASPLAKMMAREAGIDLSSLVGSGESGRIVRQDIERALESKGKPASAPAVQAVQPSTEGNFEDFPVTQMRKVIAKRLGESKFSAPHFYLTVEIGMDTAMETRRRINAMSEVKISFNDLVIKAAAAALGHHPAINSSWLGDRIRRNKDINIGVAVAVEDGLLVPVILNANSKSLSQINGEVKSLAAKAKEKKLQPQEMTGNTFTISNLGMFDIEAFTAIINPPDACILAVGTIVQKPVVKEGQLAVGHTMKVTLSCDHRVVDGATGAKFLQTLKAMLEDPIRILA
jgi:pyruvate dehydrogenase E2 component (dihydrolipoamide acetyltransferase)